MFRVVSIKPHSPDSSFRSSNKTKTPLDPTHGAQLVAPSASLVYLIHSSLIFPPSLIHAQVFELLHVKNVTLCTLSNTRLSLRCHL